MAISTRTFTTELTSRLGGIATLSFASAKAVIRNLINRRAAHRIAEMPEYLLTDIGLKRDDIHDALSRDWRSDPTYILAVRAAYQRRGE